MARRLLFVTLVATALLVALPLAAYGGHPHWLQTPGTCVEDLGSGQTSQTSGGGFHRFHNNVHLGQPGTSAFANENNPVSVGKGTCP